MSAHTEFEAELREQIDAYLDDHYDGREQIIFNIGDGSVADWFIDLAKQAVDTYIIGENMDVSPEALGIVDQDNFTLEESIHIAIGRGMNLHRELSREALWGKSKDNASKEKDV